MEKINAVITGIGGYVPEDVLTNEDLCKMVDTTDEWIMTRVGIKERTNIEALKEMLYERVKQIHITRFPYNDFLFQQYDEE